MSCEYSLGFCESICHTLSSGTACIFFLSWLPLARVEGSVFDFARTSHPDVRILCRGSRSICCSESISSAGRNLLLSAKGNNSTIVRGAYHSRLLVGHYRTVYRGKCDIWDSGRAFQTSSLCCSCRRPQPRCLARKSAQETPTL